MTDKPLVSIIIPTYNDQQYILLCINSVKRQTYRNLEVIIVDDGSNDGTSQLLDKVKLTDKRIKVFHKENTGVSDTRNFGVSKANGKYICFSDADDLLEKDYIEYLLEMISINNADIAVTTKMFSTFDNHQEKKVFSKLISGTDAAISILAYRIPIGVYSKMFSAKFLKEKNIKFNTNLYIGEGFNYNFDAFQAASKVMISNKKIYFYRRDNPTSATSQFSIDKAVNSVEALELINNHILSKSSEMMNAWNYAYWRTYTDAYDAIVLAKKQKQYQNFYKKSLSIVRKKSFYAFKANVSVSNRIRAIIMTIYPKAIPWLMKVRKYTRFK